jgi:hypothetical protein
MAWSEHFHSREEYEKSKEGSDQSQIEIQQGKH